MVPAGIPRVFPRARLAVALALLLALASAPASAALLPDDFVDESVAAGLEEPVNFDFLPDGRVLVVERVSGRIRVVLPGAAVQPDPVGRVEDIGITWSEEGLLGIAVDPRWPQKPYVYVHHTSARSRNIRVARYALTGDLAFTGDGTLVLDSLSRRDVLSDLPNDWNNHNGGTMLFGPDGLLHVALGDDNVACAAPDIHQPRGKILRLEVRNIPDGPGPVWPYQLLVPPGNPYAGDIDPRVGLVWLSGLRNPWSFDIDMQTGALAIGDVGQDSFEEVNYVQGGGANLGWPLFEGEQVYKTSCPEVDLANLVMPIHTYERAEGRTVIVAGFANAATREGNSFPHHVRGAIFFLDFYLGWLRCLEPAGEGWQLVPPLAGQPSATDFGQGFGFVSRMRFGTDGRLWYLQGDQLRRIAYTGIVGVPAPGDRPAGDLALRAFPSPTTGPVHFEFAAPGGAGANLRIVDVRGRRVRDHASGGDPGDGPRRWTWDGRDGAGTEVPAGVYFATLSAAGETATRRIVRIRG